MRTIAYLLTAAFLFSATPVFAHCGICGLGEKGSMSTEDMVAKKMEKMTGSLGLTAEQAPQVEALLKEKMDKKKAIKKEKSAKIDALGEEYSIKIKALLTDEQKTKYDAMKEEWKKGSMKGSMKGSAHEHKGSDYEMKGSK